jgi:PAS domain S-box-containing protein
MTLRNKTLLIIAVTFLGLVVILNSVWRIILLDSFEELEQHNTQRDVERALNALSSDLASLDATAFDWAAWDDTYAFLEDHNEDYVESNLVDGTFGDLGLNLMLFVNSSGETVLGKAFDLENEREVPIPPAIAEHLSPDGLLLRHPDPESHIGGIVLLPKAPMLVASRPILTSEDEGPIRGTLLMGRYLDSAEVERLAEVTLSSLAIYRFDDPQMPTDVVAARTVLSEAAPFVVRPLNGQSVAGYTLIDDINGESVLVLRVDTSREVYRHGQTSASLSLLSLLAVGLVFGLITIWLLEKQILSRLATLSEGVNRIGSNGDLSARVAAEGSDELSSLAQAINRMLTALEQSQQELRVKDCAIASSINAVALAELDGKLTYANDALLEMWGYGRDEALGKDVAALWHNEGQAQEARQALFSRGRWTGELTAKRKDGAPFEVQVSAHVVHDERGEPICTMASSIDITEHKRAEERMRRQERLAAVGQLAAGIAHDFNNLLTSIIGFAELVGMHEGLPESAKEDLKQIVEGGRRAAHLIHQILDFSRKSIVQRRPLDLSPFLKESIRFLQRTIPEHIRVVLETGPDQYVALADPAQLQRALTNLAVNSRDAMPEGGELRFRMSRFTLEPGDEPPHPNMEPGDWIALAVVDTGAGMPPEVSARLFEPFFTTKRPGEGTGLGLAQVYGIVRQHEGFIGVETEVGKGTVFTIYLPSLAEKKEAPPERGQEEPVHGQGETILLVEDEPQVLGLGSAMLNHLGYRVLTAPSGAEALDLYYCQMEEIALVLTDMVMPQMGGVELFHALRLRDPQVRVMVMTGYPLEEEGRGLLEQGIVAWVQKPLSLGQLSRAVRDVLE